MTDEHWPPRLIVKEYRHNPVNRSVWINVEGFRSMDLGIDEGDRLYILRQQDINRLWDELNTLGHENAVQKEKLKEYEEYFRLQKKLQEEKE